jgi:hypothetical protein
MHCERRELGRFSFHGSPNVHVQPKDAVERPGTVPLMHHPARNSLRSGAVTIIAPMRCQALFVRNEDAADQGPRNVIQMLAIHLDRDRGELNILAGPDIEGGRVLDMHVDMRKVAVPRIAAASDRMARRNPLSGLDRDAPPF